MDEVLQQDLTDKSPEQNMLIAQLLFKKKPKAKNDELIAAYKNIVGELINVSVGENGMVTCGVPKYKAEFEDHPEGVPVFSGFMQSEMFDIKTLSPIVTSQFWDVPEGEKLLSESRWMISVFSMMASALHYKEQAELFLAQVEAALIAYPECIGIFVPSSGKLTNPEEFLHGRNYSPSSRFIKLAVNARFFNIQGTNDMLVDTLGFSAFGAPEVQVHFHDLDPNNVVNYVYNIASYQFENEFPVENGDTIDGLDGSGNISREVYWHGQYEQSLIQPVRTVLDINCGEYAAGNRE